MNSPKESHPTDERATSPQVQSATPVPEPKIFRIHRGNRDVQISYEELFATGHKLWLKHKYVEAAKVFKVLSEVTDRGPRAHLFLAHCKAMQNDFMGCSGTLYNALPKEKFGDAAIDLHNTFILWRVQFSDEILKGLVKIVNDYPALATPCLMLSDFLIEQGKSSQSPKALRQAIKRDRPNGSISRIAKHDLAAVPRKDSV